MDSSSLSLIAQHRSTNDAFAMGFLANTPRPLLEVVIHRAVTGQPDSGSAIRDSKHTGQTVHLCFVSVRFVPQSMHNIDYVGLYNEESPGISTGAFFYLRRGRDLNPRYPFGVHRISSAAPSTTRPPLQSPLILRGRGFDFHLKMTIFLRSSSGTVVLTASMISSPEYIAEKCLRTMHLGP